MCNCFSCSLVGQTMMRLNRKISRLSPIPLIFMLVFFCVFYIFYTRVPYSKEETNETIANDIPKENIDLHIRRPKSQQSPLFIFDTEYYEAVKEHDVQAPNTCVQSGLKAIIILHMILMRLIVVRVKVILIHLLHIISASFYNMCLRKT